MAFYGVITAILSKRSIADGREVLGDPPSAHGRGFVLPVLSCFRNILMFLSEGLVGDDRSPFWFQKGEFIL